MELNRKFHTLAALSPGKESPVSDGWVELRTDSDALEKGNLLRQPEIEYPFLLRPAFNVVDWLFILSCLWCSAGRKGMQIS